MSVPPWLWIVVTLVGVFAQTFRNAAQRSVTGALGATGATYVRFLFALPSVLLLSLALTAYGHALPAFNPGWLAMTVVAGMVQILATALMLLAMRERSFLVTTAYIKVEPVLIAIFGFLFLHEALSLGTVASVIIVTGAVVALSWPQRDADQLLALRPAAFGIGAGALFAMSAVLYRGAILSLGGTDYMANGSWTLALSLVAQTLVMTVWILAREPKVMAAVRQEWRPSLTAGTLGALASECWFLAFGLETATRVRTLALTEILVAWLISHRLFAQYPTKRELVAIAVMLAGLAILVNS